MRITDEWSAQKTLIAMTVMLVATAFIDAIVSLDFFLGDGEQARTVLAIASVLWLAVAGYAATVADNTRPDNEANTTAEDFTSSSSALPASTAKELDLRGSFRFHEEFAVAVKLMQGSLIDVKPLITHTLPLSDALKAFEIASDKGQSMKAQIDFS